MSPLPEGAHDAATTAQVLVTGAVGVDLGPAHGVLLGPTRCPPDNFGASLQRFAARAAIDLTAKDHGVGVFGGHSGLD
jgi:hypothetical protein